GPNWKCARSRAYQPIPDTGAEARGYYVSGPGDRVAAAAYPWGWESRDFDDSGWSAAAVVSPAAGREARDVHSRWMLVPRTIPAMEERPEAPMKVRRVEGAASWNGAAPANSKIT